MKLIKKSSSLILALVLSIGLTACNKTNAPEDKASTQTSESVKSVESNPEKNVTSTKQVVSNESSSNDMTSDESSSSLDTSNMSDEEKIATLEDSIFENRVRARAAELLIENNPASVESFKDKLDEVLEQSNQLNERANELLQELQAN